MEKVALSLEPQGEIFGHVPLITVLRDHGVFDSLVEAKELIMDLVDLAPQVVWVEVGRRASFELELAGLDIAVCEVNKAEAERINVENRVVRGTIELRVRSRGGVSSELIGRLKSEQLISGYRSGGNADGIYHWKDDRWYEDFLLTIFKEEDIDLIEALVREYYYIVVRD
ncbi:MAG: hypothetical protein ACSHX6_14885 [Akkermansiaceae bacterium]